MLTVASGILRSGEGGGEGQRAGAGSDEDLGRRPVPSFRGMWGAPAWRSSRGWVARNTHVLRDEMSPTSAMSSSSASLIASAMLYVGCAGGAIV